VVLYLGAISPMTFEMDPEINGSLVLFPSTLHHQVYPFFESDDYRVSISGNIYFDPNGSGQVTTDMDTRIDQLQNSML